MVSTRDLPTVDEPLTTEQLVDMAIDALPAVLSLPTMYEEFNMNFILQNEVLQSISILINKRRFCLFVNH